MLEYDKLEKSLNKMLERGVKPAHITEASGVHNIQRLASGKNVATIDSWVKLHEAFPDDIPEPSYCTGKKVMKISTASGSIANQGDNANNCIKGVVLSPEEQSLINALRRLGDRKETVILELLGIVAKELKS